MPIRSEQRKCYPADWPAISRRVRAEAGNRCEWCGAPNGQTIKRVDRWWYDAEADGWRDELGALWPDLEEREPRMVRIVLTVAHLDHDPRHCDRSNLRALCQRCHLRYDAAHHASTARRTRARKSGQLELIEESSA